MTNHENRSDSEYTNTDQVFSVYADRLAKIASRKLSSKLRSRVDGEDVAQSALRTFCRRFSAGEFQIDSEAELWSLLCQITICKARSKARFHSAARRSPRQEQRIEDDVRSPAVSLDEDLIVVNDLVDNLLKGLPEQHGEILGLLLQGHSRTEVAEQLGLSRMTVHRVLDVLKARLGSELSEAE